MKRVEDTTAGKAIAAYIVTDRKGDCVARVQWHFSGHGGVTCNVLQSGDARAERVAKALGYELDAEGKLTGVKTLYNGKRQTLGHLAGRWPYEVANFQSGHAGGYGYDKKTASLSRLCIDGHMMTDHCGERLKRPKGRLWQDSDKKRLGKRGYALANWQGPRKPDGPTYGREGVPDDASGYTDAYRLEGLAFLGAIGYRVYQAI